MLCSSQAQEKGGVCRRSHCQSFVYEAYHPPRTEILPSLQNPCVRRCRSYPLMHIRFCVSEALVLNPVHMIATAFIAVQGFGIFGCSLLVEGGPRASGSAKTWRALSPKPRTPVWPQPVSKDRSIELTASNCLYTPNPVVSVP